MTQKAQEFLKKIAEHEAELDKDRKRNTHDFDVSSSHSVLCEIVAAYDRALEIDAQKLHRGMPTRLVHAIEIARQFSDG